jgi:hypothetical protein
MSNFTRFKTSKFAVLDLESNRGIVSPQIQSIQIQPSPPIQNAIGASSDNSTNEIENLILTTLAQQGKCSAVSVQNNYFYTGVISDSWDFAIQYNLDHQNVVGTMKSLETDYYVSQEPKSDTLWILTTEGQDIALNGSPEYQVLPFSLKKPADDSLTR